MSPDGGVVGRVAVADEMQLAVGGRQLEQLVEDAGRRAHVASVGRSPRPGGGALPPSRRAAPDAGVGRGVENVDQPGVRSDGGADSEGQVLGELEGLEVIEDDGLVEASLELGVGASEQQQGVATEPGADPGDGGSGAAEGPGDLAVGGPGVEHGGDGEQQLGSLEVVEGREGVGVEGALAGQAGEAAAGPPALAAVDAVEAVAVSGAGTSVLGAWPPGAEGGSELLQSLNGGAWPSHGGGRSKPGARTPGAGRSRATRSRGRFWTCEPPEP